MTSKQLIKEANLQRHEVGYKLSRLMHLIKVNGISTVNYTETFKGYTRNGNGRYYVRFYGFKQSDRKIVNITWAITKMLIALGEDVKWSKKQCCMITYKDEVKQMYQSLLAESNTLTDDLTLEFAETYL